MHTFSNPRKAGTSGTVIVETKQQDVSCFLWPIFKQKQALAAPAYNSFVEPTHSSNLITSPTFSTHKPNALPSNGIQKVTVPANDYDGNVRMS